MNDIRGLVMEQYINCLDCKHCSYNVMLKQHQKYNFLKRLFYKYLLEAQKKYPRCLNPKVYKIRKKLSSSDSDIFDHLMFCSLARTDSYENNVVKYSCCEWNAKHFEDDNII